MKKVRKCKVCGKDISHRGNRSNLCEEHQIEKTKENKERWEVENRKKRDSYRKGERTKSKSKGSNPLNRSIWKTHTHKESEMGESVYKFTSLMDELEVLSKRKDDVDYLNSTLERYNLKLYDYEYPDLPEIKRKYNKLKQTLRSGLVVSGDAYNQVIQNKRDDAFTPPHSEMGLADCCLDDVWKDIDVLRHKIDGMKSSMRDLYVESEKENPSISRGEFVSTERFRETFGEIQELERKIGKDGKECIYLNGKWEEKRLPKPKKAKKEGNTPIKIQIGDAVEITGKARIETFRNGRKCFCYKIDDNQSVYGGGNIFIRV